MGTSATIQAVSTTMAAMDSVLKDIRKK